MAKYDYNLIVIGAGAAGLVASYIAAATKAKVALIERDLMGGDCLNTGCVPSKALIHAANLAHRARHAAACGINIRDVSVDFAAVMAHVQRTITAIAPHDSVERYTSIGVDCIQGEARVLDGHRVEVDGRILTSRAMIIATGARPHVPAIKGLESIHYYTSDTIWNMPALPEHMVILGGGAIGCEMAQAFARLGARVSLVERAGRLLSREDEEVSAAITAQLANDGVNILTDHQVIAVGQQAVTCEHQGRQRTLPHDNGLLLALGRTPNVKGFGLEAAGVLLKETGHVAANPFMQTNIKSIYVCGDVTGPYQFTHVAAHQAWYASINALFSPFKRFKVDYRVIPWAVFTDPEIARIGLNEAEATAEDVAYEVTRYEMQHLDRAIAEGRTQGFVKVLTKPGKDTILGAMIVGAHAAELLTEFVTAMKQGTGLNAILSTIHSYPTFSEANKYVAGEWKKAHVPAFAEKAARLFHRLRA